MPQIALLAAFFALFFPVVGMKRAHGQTLLEQRSPLDCDPGSSLSPAPATGAAYLPGVNVYGDPVPPADAPTIDSLHPLTSRLTLQLDVLEKRNHGIPGLEANLDLGSPAALRAANSLGGLDDFRLPPCKPQIAE